jgi:fructokinase
LGRIVAIGEVVADIYRDESSSAVELPFTARPGGAPANVAVAAARLGEEAAFAGSVGRDLFGDFILRALEAEGVQTSAVRRCEPPTRTSLAFVEIGEDGDRSFTFYRSDPAADELISPEDISEEFLSAASFVNFGSILLIKDPARSAVRKAARLAHDLIIPTAFDVNFREHLWSSVEAAREAVDPLLDLSTIVKLGDDEVAPLLGTESTEEAVEVVDATGAGDAFLAATLVHLSEDSKGSFDEERVREAVSRGTAAGALACTEYGAMRALPSKSELERFMVGG